MLGTAHAVLGLCGARPRGNILEGRRRALTGTSVWVDSQGWRDGCVLVGCALGMSVDCTRAGCYLADSVFKICQRVQRFSHNLILILKYSPY